MMNGGNGKLESPHQKRIPTPSVVTMSHTIEVSQEELDLVLGHRRDQETKKQKQQQYDKYLADFETMKAAQQPLIDQEKKQYDEASNEMHQLTLQYIEQHAELTIAMKQLVDNHRDQHFALQIECNRFAQNMNNMHESLQQHCPAMKVFGKHDAIEDDYSITCAICKYQEYKDDDDRSIDDCNGR